MCKELQGGYSFMIIFSHVYTTYFCAVESIFLFIAENLSIFSLMIELVGLPRADSKFLLGRGCFCLMSIIAMIILLVWLESYFPIDCQSRTDG